MWPTSAVADVRRTSGGLVVTARSAARTNRALKRECASRSDLLLSKVPPEFVREVTQGIAATGFWESSGVSGVLSTGRTVRIEPIKQKRRLRYLAIIHTDMGSLIPGGHSSQQSFESLERALFFVHTMLNMTRESVATMVEDSVDS